MRGDLLVCVRSLKLEPDASLSKLNCSCKKLCYRILENFHEVLSMNLVCFTQMMYVQNIGCSDLIYFNVLRNLHIFRKSFFTKFR